VSGGGVNHTYNVTTNLPGDTSGRRFLFGTQSFAALGIVQPDYIVPDNFFPTGGGTVNWADVDPWTYQPLPTDGILALNRDNTITTNSPMNFAGQSGSVTAGSGAPSRNYQGLWYKSPAESEAGWGVNVAHQGDVLFATWFTYDTDGSGLWLVGSDVEKTATDTYTGTLYKTTGPAFSSVPFDPHAVTVTPVGSVTFAFTDLNNGTFTYTYNGTTQGKSITRQIFDARVPTCVSNGTPAQPFNYGDLWYKSPAESEAGWGVNVTHQGDILFATWFTYDAAGKGMWLVMSRGDKTADGTYSGPLYRTTGPAYNAVPWDKNQVHLTQVGTATFTFTDFSNGTFAYTVNGVSQSKTITRQRFKTPTACNF
jgi:hypothetical protein